MKQTTQPKTQASNHSFFWGFNRASDAYKLYKEENRKSTTTRRQYLKIVHTFFLIALKHLINGGEVKLLSGVGTLKVVKRKRDLKNLKPDWQKTKELWANDEEAKNSKQLVYHLNEHSGGHFYRFFWSRGRPIIFRCLRGDW